MGNKEHQASPWQKIIRMPDDEVENDGGLSAWIRRYLDLADLLLQRVQHRTEHNPYRHHDGQRGAA